MSRKSLLSLTLAALMVLCPVMGAFAERNVATSDEVTEHEIQSAAISLQLATEGMVLLDNHEGVLPIANVPGDQPGVALYGIGAVSTIKGGTGSGAVNNRIVYPDGSKVDGVAIASSVLDGFKNAGYTVVNEEEVVAMADAPAAGGGFGMGRSNLAADPALTFAQVQADAEKTDTAFYVIRRNAGEGADRQPIKGDYYLSDIELGNIQLLSAVFENVVVILNVVSIDASWFAESGADALVLMSNPGMLAGDALVRILNGSVTPSGKLVDTWADSIDAYPSTEYFAAINEDDPWSSQVEYYAEGIYNGYRYFDTFAADRVVYPFGYGLSYTDFEITVDSVAVEGDQVVVTATVKNTGKTYAGKEVVEVYFSAPAGKLDKPYQELVAFGKTDTLEPMQSQTLTISFDAAEMSSYDEEQAAYVMEAGDYVIRVGNSSRNTEPAAVITLDRDVITEQLVNLFALDTPGNGVGGANGRSTPPYTQPIELSVEENVANFNSEVEKFEASVADGVKFDDGKSTADATKLALDAAAVENTVCVYPELAEGATYEDVNEYISATTEDVDVNGFDYANGVEYNVNKIYFDADGNAVTEKPEELANFRVKSGSEEDGTAEYYTLKDVYDGVLTLEQFVSGMTIEELANMVQGGNKSPNADGQSAGGTSPSTAKLPAESAAKIDDLWVRGEAGETCGLYIDSRLIPNTTNADGPAGLRVSQTYEWEGTTYYQFCTAYPVGNMIAQSWDVDVARQMGAAVGADMVAAGVTMWLAPGMNIHRNLLCGRNFEYYSEDPLIAGMMAGSEAQGLQSNGGVGVTFKHFALNNQETSRNSSNSVASERAIREIYLKGFEIAVKMAKPMGIMTSYNVINNVPAANDYDLIENALRKEWGFDGMVMTDWGGSGGSSDARMMHAGNDIVMAGKTVANIRGYITDMAPAITFDADGLATDGGFPYINMTTRASGTSVTYTTVEQWGDYKLDAEGRDYVVKTTTEAFDTANHPVRVYVDADGVASLSNSQGATQDMQQWTAREMIDGKDGMEGKAASGVASYTEEDGIVTITYKLSKISAQDNVSTGHQEPSTVDIFGDPDENTLTLGDLQKSVIHILHMVESSSQFADLIGVEAEGYTTSRADQLKVVESCVKGEAGI